MSILHNQIIRAFVIFEVDDFGKGHISCRFTVSSGMHASEVVDLLQRVNFLKIFVWSCPFCRYLSLRMDGRVRGSGVGYPPWNAFVVQLPPVKGMWSGLLDGMDGRVL